MLDIAVKSAGMAGLFDRAVRRHRARVQAEPASRTRSAPPPSARGRASSCSCRRTRDVAGAAWFGYTTFWLNRTGAPADELGASPDGTGSGMVDLLVPRHPGFVRQNGQPRAPRPGA
jgi:2-haloacid dehalogenase